MSAPTLWSPFSTASPSPKVDSRAALSAFAMPQSFPGAMVFCNESGFKGLYFFDDDSIDPVDGTTVLATSRGGNSRWILLSTAVGARQECFNVLSYGAKMDGVTPLAPFYQQALNDAAAAGGGKICVPYDPRYPGSVYNWGSTPISFNYSPSKFAANLYFQGGGASAPILIPDSFPSGSNVIEIDNPISIVSFADFVFIPQSQKAANFASLIAGNSGESLSLERCEFFGFGAPGGVISSNIASLQLKDVFIRGAYSETGGVITVSNISRGVFFDHVRIVDIGTLGAPGVPSPRGTWGIIADSFAGILISPNGGPLSSGDSCGIYMRDVFVDERNVRNVRIAGGGSRIPWVYLDGVHCNTLTATNTEGRPIEIENASTVEIRRSLGIYSSRPLTPAIVLKDVTEAKVYGEKTGGAPGDTNGAGVNRFIADSACGSVTLDECDFVLVDSQARQTTIIKDGVTRIIRRAAAPGSVITEDRTFEVDLPDIAGGGGTATVVEECEDGAQTIIAEARVSSGDGSGGVYTQRPEAALSLVAGQATMTVATTGTNPTNVHGNDVASASYGASSSALTAGAGADRQRAVLTVTNQHLQALDFAVKITVRKTWPKFNPSQFKRLWGDILVALWLPSGIVDTVGLVGTWRDYSGNGYDLTAAGALRPAFLAASGPNLLPATSWAGTQRMQVAIAGIQQLTMVSVGTFTGTNQTHMCCSASAVAWSANAFKLGTITSGITQQVVCQQQSFPPGATLTRDLTNPYRTYTATAWASQQNIYSEMTRGTLSPGGNAADTMINVCVGAQQGGTNPHVGEIQALALIKQAEPSPDTSDGGRLLYETVQFFKDLCGT